MNSGVWGRGIGREDARWSQKMNSAMDHGNGTTVSGHTKVNSYAFRSSENFYSRRGGKSVRPAIPSSSKANQDRYNIADDLRKDMECIKLVEDRAIDKSAVIDFNLDEVEVVLTEEEKTMPSSFRKLREIMKKCVRSKRFHILWPDVALKLLEETATELPLIEPGLEAQVLVVPQIENPPSFFLRLKLQKDRLNLINFILEDLVNLKMLQAVGSNDLVVGETVAVQTDSMCYRGDVLGLTSTGQVEVYLIDFGYSLLVEGDKLWEMPVELASVPALGVRACFPGFLNKDSCMLKTSFSLWQNELDDDKNEFTCLFASKIRMPSGEEVFSVELTGIVDGIFCDVYTYLIQRQTNEVLNCWNKSDIQSFVGSSDIMQLHTDFEIDIRPYFEDDCSLLKQVSAVRIASPEDMILLHVASDHTPPKWFDEMQHFYKKKELCRLYKIRGGNVLENRCYVWFNAADRLWHRVRVVKLMASKSRAMLWLLDSGEASEAHTRDMMEISPKFSRSAALSFRAHLAHVKAPKTGWSSEAVDLIKNAFGLLKTADSKCATDLGEDMILDAAVVENVDKMVGTECEQVYSKSFAIILAQKSPPNRSTVQAQLVHMKLAQPTGPSSTRHDWTFDFTGVPYYDQRDMLNHLKRSLLNSLDVTMGFNMEPDYTRALAHFKANLKMPQLTNKLLKHTAKYPVGPGLGGSIFAERSMPETIKKRLPWVKVSSADRGPGHFYIQMEHKLAELSAMTMDLYRIAKLVPALSSKSIRPGMLALAIPTDPKLGVKCGRVFILAYNHMDNMCKVLLIDYGVECDALPSRIRELPEYFSKIPPFALRAHLDVYDNDNQLMPLGFSWGEKACEVWRGVIEKLDSQSRVCYAWRLHQGDTKSGGVLKFDFFNQRLSFIRSPHGNYWNLNSSAVPTKGYAYSELNRRKDHPLLKHFFTSVGINLVYEREQEMGRVRFVPVWKHLQDAGLVINVNTKRNPFSPPPAC